MNFLLLYINNLHISLLNNDIDNAFKEIKSLIENGENINQSNYFGKTLLMSATFVDAINICKYLVENGADVNIKDNFGKTALDYSIELNKLDVANYLTSIQENQIITKDLQNLKPQQVAKKAPVFKM